MSAEYYALWFRLGGREECLIWHTNDEDGAYVDGQSGLVPTFDSFDGARRFAESFGIQLAEASRPVANWDAVLRWVEYPESEGIDASEFLDVWNLSEDIARCIGKEVRPPKQHLDLYDKLFWGSNLPSVTPPGERYDPVFSSQEEARLREVLGTALRVIREAIGR